MGNSPITLDFSKAQPIAAPPPVRLDFSKAVPINPTPQDALSRTNQNMALAMSGQQAQMRPDDQAQFEAGRTAGGISAAGTLAGSALGAVTAAPTIATAVTKVPGGRDLVTGRMLPWVEQQIETQGPSLLRQGAGAVADFAAAHKITTGTVGLWALHKLGIHPLDILKELIE